MSRLEDLIAKRNELEEEIQIILSAQSEYSPTVEMDQSLGRYKIDCGGRSTAPNKTIINIVNDNSVQTTTHNVTNRSSEVNTHIAGGDSALSVLGGLFGRIFD